MSSATWQFSNTVFSPRSVVSVNGHTGADDGLLRVRTDLQQQNQYQVTNQGTALTDFDAILETYTDRIAQLSVSLLWNAQRSLVEVPAAFCNHTACVINPSYYQGAGANLPWPYIPAVIVPVGQAGGKYGSMPALNDYDTVDRHGTLVRIQVHSNQSSQSTSFAH